MTRNTNSQFSEIPYIDKPRSIFDRSCGHKTSFNAGSLIPIFWDNVLPGDTWKITTSKVVRMQTLLTPLMDNVDFDFYWFFCPWRLIFGHTKEFFGENTQSAWVPQTSYRLPAISSPENGFNSGTIADYLGLPVGVTWSNQDRNAPMALPFRCYSLICDQYFRDENLTDPLNIPIGDADQTGSNGSNYINDVANGGVPFKVAKYHDYFTSCLPSPQKANNPVSINIGQDIHSFYPVYSLNAATPFIDTDDLPKFTNPAGVDFGAKYTGTFYKAGMSDGAAYGSINNSTASNIFSSVGSVHHDDEDPIELTTTASDSRFQPHNLWSLVDQDLPNSFTVNELRLAFQLQRYYEQLARGGSRYIEYMRNFYGVTSPDARLQRVEYLGGNRVPVSIHQIENTAQTASDFLGDVGAMSVTSDINDDVFKSFSEFGIIMCVCCVRYTHTYGQGIDRAWTRRDLFDQYVPCLAHIGEQPVFSYELYADGNMDNDDVFGYNEAWADYRYKPSRVSGEMRPGITNSLASWHLADYYTQTPTLSDSWIREDPAMIDRALSVTSAVSNQFFGDFWFDCKVTRVMPMYSVPGMIDHF